MVVLVFGWDAVTRWVVPNFEARRTRRRWGCDGVFVEWLVAFSLGGRGGI